MSIQVGQAAADFTLFSTDKEQVTLSSFKGRNVLILFFPLAFTSVCTNELCSTRDNIAVYGNANAEVVGISVDSLFTLDQFKKANDLNFTLLSDFNKEVSEAYGALYENFVLGMKGVSKRAAFLIDAEGVVQYAEVLEDAGKLPNFDEIQAKLASLVA